MSVASRARQLARNGGKKPTSQELRAIGAYACGHLDPDLYGRHKVTHAIVRKFPKEETAKRMTPRAKMRRETHAMRRGVK